MTHAQVDIRFTDALGRQQMPPAPARGRDFRPLAAAIGALMILTGAAPSYAQQPPPETPAVRQLMEATRAYAWLHRRVENNLAPLEVNANPDTIHRLVQEMAAAIRAARPDARQGEFFTNALAVELRFRIAEALAADHFTAWDVHAVEAANGIDPALVPLTVNGAFPWIYASAMFPCVLRALPELPPELQYRMVGTTLVLIDVHAGLILDLLPHALADTEL